MIIEEDEYLAHYGVLRRSGRYPWGSGKDQDEVNRLYLGYLDEMKAKGLSEVEIAKATGISTTQLRAARTIARAQQRQAQISQAVKLKDKGLSNGAIATKMGLAGESSVRALLADGAADKAKVLTATSDMLKQEVAEKRFVDIGSGVENHIGISKEKLNAAVSVLREEGYEVHSVPVRQLGTGLDTRLKVLAPPGTTWADVRRNTDQIQQISAITRSTDDGGRTYGKIHTPISINPKRVEVRYREDGGHEADGVIYVREGVKDVSLGNSRYAQVRIQVGKDRYLKGMAMYKDDLPEGVDLVFNTAKSRHDPEIMGDKMKAMKKMTDDPNLPFGSVIRRQVVSDKGGPNEKVTSAMNIVHEEGDWKNWSKSLSTQFLSKQDPTLAKQQLGKTFASHQKDFDEIMALTNPTVKRKFLEDFAEGADHSAMHLEAAALSANQRWHAILPINSMSPNQVYAPNYANGEKVVLVRFPHAGKFEIPELTVNNRHPEARKLLGNAPDAIGIHHSVAQRLSGADFDGDTVIVIPNHKGQVKHESPLAKLKNFDPQREYPGYPGMKKMTKAGKGLEMGNISNLITDMTVQGAAHDELARAVRHSMVVIDAEKHGLDWKRSAIENGIPALKERYQGGARRGASTLFSLAESKKPMNEIRLRKASEGGPIDPHTGKKVYVPTGATKLNRKTGEHEPKQGLYKRLAVTDNAHDLSSGTRIEHVYAEHSNRLKDLANQARLASINTPRLAYSKQSAKVYANEVAVLKARLSLAQRNAPLERQAQVVANATVRVKRDANPDLSKETIKKLGFQELEIARTRLGAKKEQIKIEPRLWEAIQAGAISNNMLSDIMKHVDTDTLRELATPRHKILMSPSNTARAKALLGQGHTRAEVAARLGVSLSTLDEATVASND